MILDWHFYALAIPAVILVGLAKGGFAGMGALSMPMLAFAVDPVRAAAILLPILIAQDVVGVWAFRRSVDWRLLGWMVPGAVLGIWLGYRFAATVSPMAVMAAVGAISVLFGSYRLWASRHAAAPAGAGRWPEWVGALFGVASGFTSQIAHAGQPPFQLWVLPRNLPRDVLVGTTAVFFAAINWIKVPAYAALGQFTAANLLTSAALLPLAILSTLAGVWLVRRVSPARFYRAIYWLMVAVGLGLIWEALG
ncbi:sulfite exporter TauE/SafE family protein [Sphingomonas sp. CJ20]